MRRGISSRPVCTTRQAGFTLIELIITVVVVSVLAAVALPAFFDQVRKSRRAEAISAINQVAQAQERWRSNNPAYAAQFIVTNGKFVGVAASGAGSFNTPGGNYSLSMSGTGATTYNVLAQAQGSQARDTTCVFMQAAAASGNMVYSSGPTSGLGNSASVNGQCWRR